MKIADIEDSYVSHLTAVTWNPFGKTADFEIIKNIFAIDDFEYFH